MILSGPESRFASALRPSPNHGERRGRLATDAIILHYTGMRGAESALSWLCDPRSQVSCHYFVSEDGCVTQLVNESRRAWHAGQSFWRGERDVNSMSIGVEIDNAGHEFGSPPFCQAQIAAVIDLCRDLCARLAIPAERVLAHSDVAPARKRDPGEAFPWARLHAAGIGHWRDPPPPSKPLLSHGERGAALETMQALLARYGYECPQSGVFDEGTQTVVRAFQRHFRPGRVDGEIDLSTLEALKNVLASLPAAAAARSG